MFDTTIPSWSPNSHTTALLMSQQAGLSLPVLPAFLTAPQPQQIGDVSMGPGAQKPYVGYRLCELDDSEKRRLERAKKYAMEQNIKAVMKKQSIHVQQQQQQSVKRAQALMLLSRIYVGSISYEITEDIIRKTFCPFGPIKSVSLSFDPLTQKHKGFCFLEYELPEAAQLALEQMNNVPMGGRNLKVGRPSNIPQAQPIIDEIIGEAKLYNRIYVAGVHTDLSEDDLRMVFEAFGNITYCKLQPESSWTGKKHRGFGYIEYDSAQSAMEAVNSMNMFDLGGQFLRVGRAITPPGAFLSQVSTVGEKGDSPSRGAGAAGAALPTAAAVAAAEITAQIIAQQAQNFMVTTALTPTIHTSSVSSGGSPGSIARAVVPPPAVVIPKLSSRPKVDSRPADSGKGVAADSSTSATGSARGPSRSAWDEDDEASNDSPFAAKAGSRVVLLQNMVSADECDDDLEGEVREECSKFGQVRRVRIHLTDGAVGMPEGEVKIFVQFDTSQSANAAIAALNGRFFAMRQIQASEFEESKFVRGELDS